MKRTMLALIALAAAGILSAEPLADGLDGRIDTGLSLLYQAQYDASLDTFRAFIKVHPRNPAGYFFTASAYQARALAYESDAWDRTCAIALDSALMLSSQAIKLHPGDPMAYFFRGASYAYMASRDARSGSLLAALGKGLSGMSDLKKAVALDSTLYDAYVGLGTYHYFRTKAASIFKWLPFIGDRREQGIGELRLAAAKGRYTKVMAQNALLWVLIDYGKYDQALAVAQQLERDHPSNHAFHWGVPDICFKTGQWARAAEGYERLLQLNADARPMNNYNRIFITARLAKCRYEERRYADACALAREAVALPISEDAARRLQGERTRAQQVMNLSEKMMRTKQ